MYMLQFSLAADAKLRRLVNAMQLMTLSPELTIPAARDEPDEIRRIPTEDITILEEFSSERMQGCTIRFSKARMVDRAGRQRAVIVKQTMDTRENEARDAFDIENELRRDLLRTDLRRRTSNPPASRPSSPSSSTPSVPARKMRGYFMKTQNERDHQ
ncbi:hypothetical protein SISSUDRAFT_1055030 [Sistotremastrum suecicum HHB10207 ss-3]|uniref:Uncharacterized protein n=1 Tax=Sistotremastrum suecicum HHB10207 ss-3 TaxID=1314776 RepID=A0A165Y2V2_9AGAM|nr:hypothetical protein SISSUDRAFT_1055030 [Sistotremastrum suecicum HHB10207 ss-3]